MSNMISANNSSTDSSGAQVAGGGGTKVMSADRWNVIKQEIVTLRKTNGELVKNEKKLRAERDKLEVRLRKTEETLKKRKVYRGRNMMRVSLFDEDDHACNKVIAGFIRNEVFPKTKFLHSSWSQYNPENTKSFFSRLSGKLSFPPNLDRSIFWQDKIVPLVNKKICETRANISGSVRQGYLSENTCNRLSP